MELNESRYAVFLDIDGTLMGKSHQALKKNLDVIQKVRSLGHKVLINTGRATAYLPEEIDTKKYFDGVISGAGARIILDGEEIFCRLAKTDKVRSFCEFCMDIENVCILEGVEKMFFVGPRTEADYEWVCISPENIDEHITDNLKIEKFTILGNAPSEIQRVMGEDYLVLQHSTYAEIIQKSFTKAGAMEFVLKRLGLSKKQSIAMGDSLNDFDMIESAGIGVAMGNAIREIKDIAHMITDDVDAAGVAAALEKIFGI